jgi:hypothetical protein
VQCQSRLLLALLIYCYGVAGRHRPCDLEPPPPPRAARRMTQPWRLAMQAQLKTEDAKAWDVRRKQTVDPVVGTIKVALGVTRFHLRGLANVAATWTLVALACGCRGLYRLPLR